MLTPQALQKSPLFQGISYEEYLRMVDCFQATKKTFKADEVIYDFGEERLGAVGIVERGTAELIRTEESGVETVLEGLGPGGVFGRDLAFSVSLRDSLQIISRTACEVLFINYACITKRCEKACGHHSMLVQNMLELMSDKAQALSQRVDVLSRRSIREKLMCYFCQMAESCGNSEFTLPFSLGTLADYIAADRSAMMRELKRMREEGLLASEGRWVELKQFSPLGTAGK